MCSPYPRNIGQMKNFFLSWNFLTKQLLNSNNFMLNINYKNDVREKQRRKIIEIFCNVYTVYAQYRQEMLFFQNRGACSTGVKSANRQILRSPLHFHQIIMIFKETKIIINNFTSLKFTLLR